MCQEHVTYFDIPELRLLRIYGGAGRVLRQHQMLRSIQTWAMMEPDMVLGMVLAAHAVVDATDKQAQSYSLTCNHWLLIWVI